MSNDDLQRADHFQHLYEQASEGLCGHSGMPLPVCKRTICDCFEFPWLAPATPTQQGEQTMTAQPTVEDYLAQNADPEDDTDDPQTPTPDVMWALPTNPLESIAESLRTIASTVGAAGRELDMRQELDDAEAKLADTYAVLEQVLEVCKKSTSKLAISVREVINGPAAVNPPAVELAPELDPALERLLPSDDATVEVWRDFASAFGLEGTDQMNRSQIRTALGIAQPGFAGVGPDHP